MLAMPRCLLSPWVLLFFAAVSRGEIPPPSATPAKIVVSGPTSTAVDIKIVKVGQQIPRTYAGRQIHNTPGFQFYVSQHYALKSSRDENYSKMILEVAELAYPHWVALVGAEPPDPDTRMYFVCAQSGGQMIEAMKSDVGMGTAGGYGGGITICNNRSAYNYPSGTLLYHQRALVIHENLHMLQMIVYGTGGSEDFTYSGEQHVYDPAKKQLTVICFDKAPTNNWTDVGLAALRKNFVPLPKAADSLWSAGGGTGVVYQQFLWRDPDRWLKWCVWRDEYYAGRLNRESNARLMADVFGPLDKLSADWTRWIRQTRNSFHFVDWGWEQEGNALLAYGFPSDTKYWSQTDLNYAPQEWLAYDPLRMDYPAESRPPIVAPPQQGVAEPTVGYVIDFSRGLGCWGGFGLGVNGRSLCQVVLVEGRALLIDGNEFGIARSEIALPPQLQDAAKTDGFRYGVTIRIKQRKLEVTVRTGRRGTIRRFTAAVPITAAQRQRLLSRQMAIIGRGGYPLITPWIDDRRRLPPDLTRPAAANFWRFAGMDRLLTLYKAAWRLKEKAPKSLLALKAEMLEAVDEDADAQTAAVGAYQSRILAVFSDVRRCNAAAQRKALALADLAGTTIFLDGPVAGGAANKAASSIMLLNRLSDRVTAAVHTAGRADNAAHPVALCPYRPTTLTTSSRLPASRKSEAVTPSVGLTWRGKKIEIPLLPGVSQQQQQRGGQEGERGRLGDGGEIGGGRRGG